MNRKRFKKILLFFTAIISAFWFLDVSLAADGAELSSIWRGVTILLEWSWFFMVVLTTVTIIYVAIPFFKLRPFSHNWWFLFTWLVAASVSVLFVSLIYLAVRKCGFTVQTLYLFISYTWVWLWSFTISLMLPLTIMGIVIGDIKPNGKTRWDVAEKIIMGIATIWSCYLATFGATIWNLFSFC